MESPSPLSRYIPQNSKKRVFPGGSSTCMEAEVVETPPVSNRGLISKSLKQKEAIFGEIVDADLDEDCGDVMQIDEKVVPSGKGKELVDYLPSDPCDERNKWSVDDAQSSKNHNSGSDNLNNADDLGPESFYGDDIFLDMYYEDIMFDDEYETLQSHFDNLDIPTGVEASIPWLTGLLANNIKSTLPASINSSSENKLGAAGLPSSSDLSHSSLPLESVQARKKKSTPGSSFSSGTLLPAHGQTYSSTWSSPDSAQGKINSQLNNYKNLFPGEKRRSSRLKKKPFAVGATSYNSSHPSNVKQLGVDDGWEWEAFLKATEGSWVTQGSNVPYNGVHFPKETALDPMALYYPTAAETSAISSPASSSKVEYGNPEEIMNRFQLFKNFDTVEDFSDHYYYRDSSVKQASKDWAKKIQDEWRMLEKDLPDTIFVRVCESRMDLLRAVIVGAEGTPYHDGLFFFDVFFPSDYPNIPPKVHYYSGGLRINPNLYNCGKVCLSLLNTWSGSEKEMWTPGVSTMLQVLVSIQGLILNAKPYFNEPGYAGMSGSVNGEKSSLRYNERTFILSLKTMVYNIRRPPKYFEDIVGGHFHSRALNILEACQSYINGAQVGCLVKGGVQEVDKGDDVSCARVFRYDVANFINTLVDAFKQVGASECEKFLPLAPKANDARPVEAWQPSDIYYNFW